MENRLRKASPGVEAGGEMPGSVHRSAWARRETRFWVHHREHRARWEVVPCREGLGVGPGFPAWKTGGRTGA